MDWEILQQEKEKTKENETKQLCVLCLGFLPFAYVPGAKATMLTFSSAVLTGLRTHGMVFALDLQ